MKKIAWLITGIGLGYLFNQQMRENPKVQSAVTDLGDRAKEFGEAVSEGFREREAELAKASRPTPKPAAASSSAPKAKASSAAASKPAATRSASPKAKSTATPRTKK